MAENIFSTFNISGQGLSIQRQRLAATAKNIANVNTTKDVDGNPYRREIITVRAVKNNQFESELKSSLSMVSTENNHIPTSIPKSSLVQDVLLTAEAGKDKSEGRLVHDPSHPDADENGYIRIPDINIVTEMVDMISAQRAFEANTNVIESAKNMARDSLEI